MSIKKLRDRKKAWLNNTLSFHYLRTQLKLTKVDILQIKTEVKYGHERYKKRDVQTYVDQKIAKAPLLIAFDSQKQKTCQQCKNKRDTDYFSTINPAICKKCERKNELKHQKIIDQIDRSRSIKPKGNQMTI